MNVSTGTYNNSFFENVVPVKITEARDLKLNTDCWGLLTDYYLESVKVDCNQSGVVTSSATLRTGDQSGQITCLVKGSNISALFGLTPPKWREIESLCKPGGQLFYRYFKDGLDKKFSYEQKLFYYFCASHQIKDVLVVVFRRQVNFRTKDKNDAFIQVIEFRKPNTSLLDLYHNQLQINLLKNTTF